MKTKAKATGRKPTAKDYVKLVEWSDEDHCFIGSAPPLVGQCCHGDDETKVYKELCEIVEECIEIRERDGMPFPEPTAGREFSGKFIVRMPPEIHRLLALRALQSGESLNAYLVERLSK
jgi:predicted HicB family RNase H-like nuclease